MTVIHSNRQATTDEIAAEMDRRGAVIEGLEAALAAKDAEIERLREALDNARRAAVEDTLGALTAHELYQYRPKAFEGFIAYARAELTGGSNAPA